MHVEAVPQRFWRVSALQFRFVNQGQALLLFFWGTQASLGEAAPQ